MKRADVICIVYAVDESKSFQQLKSHWLPMVRSQRPEVLIKEGFIDSDPLIDPSGAGGQQD